MVNNRFAQRKNGKMRSLPHSPAARSAFHECRAIPAVEMHHHGSQRFFAMRPSPMRAMAIFMGTAFVERVVDVQGTQPIQPDHAVEFLEHAIQIIRNVISRIPYMTGIEANPQMAVELDTIDDGS